MLSTMVDSRCCDSCSACSALTCLVTSISTEGTVRAPGNRRCESKWRRVPALHSINAQAFPSAPPWRIRHPAFPVP
jgi:hypothetical protein